MVTQCPPEGSRSQERLLGGGLAKGQKRQSKLRCSEKEGLGATRLLVASEGPALP